LENEGQNGHSKMKINMIYKNKY